MAGGDYGERGESFRTELQRCYQLEPNTASGLLASRRRAYWPSSRPQAPPYEKLLFSRDKQT